MTSDGPLPRTSPECGIGRVAVIEYWNNQDSYSVDGIYQETCRNFAHTNYGIASVSHVMETARIQSLELWETQVRKSVKASLELHAHFKLRNPPEVPSWLCNGNIDRQFDPFGEFPHTALAGMGKTCRLRGNGYWSRSSHGSERRCRCSSALRPSQTRKTQVEILALSDSGHYSKTLLL